MKKAMMAMAVAAAVFSTACNKDKCDDSQPAEELILGEWELTEIYNVMLDSTYAPSAAERETLTFGDSLLIETPQGDTTVAYSIGNGMLSAWGHGGILTVDCETLVLDSSPVDGPRNTYARK